MSWKRSRRRPGDAILVSRRCSAAADSVLQSLSVSQVTGRGPRSLRRLPRGIQSRLEVETRGLSVQCLDLEDRWCAGDLAGCRTIVGRLSRELVEAVSPEQQERNRDAIVLCHADALFVRLLSASLDDVPRPRAPSSSAFPLALLSTSTGSHRRERPSYGHRSIDTHSGPGSSATVAANAAKLALPQRSTPGLAGASQGISWPSRQPAAARASGQESVGLAASTSGWGAQRTASESGGPRTGRPKERRENQSTVLTPQGSKGSSLAPGSAPELARDVTMGQGPGGGVVGFLLERGRDVDGSQGNVQLAGTDWTIRISEPREATEGHAGRVAGQGSREERLLGRIHMECLAALRELCYSSTAFADSLACQRMLLVRLFLFMEHPPTFDLGQCPSLISALPLLLPSLCLYSTPEGHLHHPRHLPRANAWGAVGDCGKDSVRPGRLCLLCPCMERAPSLDPLSERGLSVCLCALASACSGFGMVQRWDSQRRFWHRRSRR